MCMDIETIGSTHRTLVTKTVDTVMGGLVCETTLMGRLDSCDAEQNGQLGTKVRLTVAVSSEIFIPTRDPAELAKRRSEIDESLLKDAAKALNDSGRCDSASPC